MTHSEKNIRLIEFGKQILYKKSLPDGLPLISLYSKEVIGAQRCSMFIHNPKKSEFWTTLADGIERITIAQDKGIVGKTLSINAGIIENDVYSNDAFLGDIDTASGYKTQNIITEPMYNSEGKFVGVFELLNKDGGFDNNDAKYMKFFAKSLSDFIDLVNLYED